MKKKNILIYVATAVLLVALSFFGYVQYTTSDKDASAATDEKTETVETKVNHFERSITLDKQKMYLINENYAYFETNYLFSGEVDTLETCDVVFVANIFQTVTDHQPTVYCSRHYLDGTDDFEEKVGAFWIEDFDMSEKDIRLTIDEAFDALKKSNCVKPRSKYCTLRAQVGPVQCNPQYVFGNDNRGLAYVDAVTGEVRTENPVFENAVNLQSVETPAEWTEFIFKEKK